ncbi:MAG: ATP-binding protein [Candidatus Gastranaerophilales bacterium]|nr:ATP-binding protein [Candidatus Gastranaerophilales bacterium]
MDKLKHIVKAIRYGNLSRRIKIKHKGEIALLAESFNNMIEALEDRESMIKAYETELREQNAYLKSIFNSLADGIIIISEEFKILKINPSIAEWAGEPEKSILGKYFNDIIICNCQNDCNNGISNGSCAVIQKNKKISNEIKIQNKKTGETKCFNVLSSLVTDSQNRKNYVITLNDITQIKEMDEMRDDFIATLTHDLKVPLIAGSNTLKFLLKETFGKLNDKQKEAAENMLESNEEVIGMVNNLLDSYRHDAGKYELIKEKTDIEKLFLESIENIKPLALKRNQELKINIAQDIPNIDIDGNEIKRVIINLLNNSIAYTQKEGSIGLNAKVDRDFLVIEIFDNGKGIASKDIEHIFERFFTKARKFRKIGSGLGLYLSKKIIEKHGGTINVNSKENQGSSFVIRLPLV